MVKILTLVFIMSIIRAQTIDINALRMAQSQIGISSSSSHNNKNEVNQSKSNILLEDAIDPIKYLTGPGDLFRINIIDSDNISIYSLTISPTGSILIPSIGIVNINGLNLSNAIDVLTKKVFEIKPTAQVHIQLAEVRHFKVKVVGHLQNPGYFRVTPVTRISDIFSEFLINKKTNNEKNNDEKEKLTTKENIKKLDNFKTWEDNHIVYPELSKRNIKIIRKDDTIYVDLVSFGTLGNDRYNPYLKQGDVIFVPIKEKSISIYGGIQIPGKYEYKQNENLSQLIKIAGGLKDNNKISDIEITRFIDSFNKKTFNVKISEIDSFSLLSSDHIMVKYDQKYNIQDIIHITGEIKYPGVYSIEHGETTIKEILNRSGGYTKTADQTKLFINNLTISEIPDKEEKRILFKQEMYRSIEEKAYIKARSKTNKSSLEANSLDQLQTLMSYKLSKNDLIHVPTRFDFVEIIGGVKNPGRYPYLSDQNFNQYIEKAGGRTDNASKKDFIVKAGTGQRLRYNKQININNGDILFIPEKREINSWFMFKDILSTIGSISTLILLIQNSLGS